MQVQDVHEKSVVQNRYIDDYIDAMRRYGSARFQERFRWHVLLGLSVVGDLDDDGQRGKEQTFLAAVHGHEEVSDTLNRYVWPIRKSPYGPETRHVCLGRAKESNDVVIPDYSISTQHCEFVQVRRRILIRDCNSHNGTFVNEERVDTEEGIILRDQDEILLGRCRFEYLTNATFIERLMNMAAWSS